MNEPSDGTVLLRTMMVERERERGRERERERERERRENPEFGKPRILTKISKSKFFSALSTIRKRSFSASISAFGRFLRWVLNEVTALRMEKPLRAENTLKKRLKRVVLSTVGKISFLASF